MTQIKNIQSPRGMHDILPEEQPYWQKIISTFSQIAHQAGYNKIDTPLIENIELFNHTIGETSDIVSKEMFLLAPKSEKKDQYVLRPEFTAPIARSYVQHGMKALPKPVKLYTYGPLYRYGRPQAGRGRQFHQLDLENIGHKSSSADADIIGLCWQLFTELGIKDMSLHINTIGSAETRPLITKSLIDYFEPHNSLLCHDCQNRLRKNPLRVLDCKQEGCQKIAAESPQIIDLIDDNSKEHFYALLEYLDELDIPYLLNPKLVRGLDYYTRTVFEFIPTDDGLTIGGGGRYDGLIEMLGHEPTPGVGVGIGIERLILKMKDSKSKIDLPNYQPEIFLIQLGKSAKKKSFKLLHELRLNHFRVSCSLNKKSITGQLKMANKNKARLAIIIGEKEAMDNTIIVRDMMSGVQDTIDRDRAVSEINKRLNP